MRSQGMGVAGLKTTYLITYTCSGFPRSLQTDTPEETAASLKRLKLVKDVVVKKIQFKEIVSDSIRKKPSVLPEEP